MKNDFSVLDPVGYVNKQQKQMRMRRITDRNLNTEQTTNVELPVLSPRYVNPTMNYPSANKFGMFAKTADVQESKVKKQS